MISTTFSPTVLIAIAAGGASGAVLRYLISVKFAQLLGEGFPWGTLVVNAVGSLLIGLFIGLLQTRSLEGDLWRPLLVVGLLGGLTTFSTFSLETVSLIQRDQWVLALCYSGASLLGCIALTFLGFKIAQ